MYKNSTHAQWLTHSSDAWCSKVAVILGFCIGRKLARNQGDYYYNLKFFGAVMDLKT